MASQVILKKSSVTARVPVVGDLAFGELALNYQDGLLYYKRADGTSIGAFSAGGASPATTVSLGLVKGFTNLSIDVDGTLSLNSSNVVGALGYTPYNSSNPNNYSSTVGTITSVTATAPVVSTGGTTPVLSMAAATASVNGYLTSTNWNTFNNKQPALGFTPYNATNPSAYVTAAVVLTTAAQPNITSLGTLSTLAVTGTLTAGSLNTTGDVTVGGNFTVSGTTTTINATSLSVSDLNITIAKDATTAASANGAGLTVGGAAAATILYTSATDTWDFNKTIKATLLGNASTVTTNANLTGAITSIGNATSLGSFTSAQLLSAITNETGSGILVFNTSPTFTGTVGLPAVSLAGTVAGGGNQLNNVVIGASTPLAGNFTTLSATGAISTSGYGTFKGLRIGLDGSNDIYAAAASINYSVDTTQQHLFRVNGTLVGAFSSAGLTVTGAISASNLSGSNTGDQTNISGNAATSNYLNLNNRVSDLSEAVAAGVYRQENPSSGYDYTSTLNLSSSDGRQQLTIERTGGGMKFRGTPTGSGTASWSAWKTVLDSNNYNNYSPTLTGSNASGTWGINVTGTSSSISGYNNPAVAATANTIAYRDSVGDVTAREFVMTSGVHDDTPPSSIIGAYPTTNQLVKFTAAKTAAFLSGQALNIVGNATTSTNLSGDATNWASLRGSSVSNMLGWKNYGNNHVIFDASAGTSPSGAVVNTTNSASTWSPTYPTLMGWNGSGTYGVRVDSARVADIASSLATSNSYQAAKLTVSAAQGYLYVNRDSASSGQVGVQFQTAGTSVWWNFIEISGTSLNWYNASSNVMTLTTGGALNTVGAITQAGNQVLHAGNYTNYVTSPVTISDTTPATTSPGALWWDSTVGRTYVYYNDGSSSQWVDAAPGITGPTGPAGPTGQTGATGTTGAVNATTVFAAINNQNNTDWYRTTGNVGWYSASYAVGIYATEAGNVRTYGGASFIAEGNVTAYSDSRLKENVKVIPNALDKVKAIRGVTFTRNDLEDTEQVHTGVIAQEVLAVFPEAVMQANKDDFYTVAYGNMVGLLIEAIKEQQVQIDELKGLLND